MGESRLHRPGVKPVPRVEVLISVKQIEEHFARKLQMREPKTYTIYEQYRGRLEPSAKVTARSASEALEKAKPHDIRHPITDADPEHLCVHRRGAQS